MFAKSDRRTVEALRFELSIDRRKTLEFLANENLRKFVRGQVAEYLLR
jgi:hypothetical protein